MGTGALPILGGSERGVGCAEAQLWNRAEGRAGGARAGVQGSHGNLRPLTVPHVRRKPSWTNPESVIHILQEWRPQSMFPFWRLVIWEGVARTAGSTSQSPHGPVCQSGRWAEGGGLWSWMALHKA